MEKLPQTKRTPREFAARANKFPWCVYDARTLRIISSHRSAAATLAKLRGYQDAARRTMTATIDPGMADALTLGKTQNIAQLWERKQS